MQSPEQESNISSKMFEKTSESVQIFNTTKLITSEHTSETKNNLTVRTDPIKSISNK